MRLGSFRVRETVMSRRPMGGASLRSFCFFGFGWRVAVFFAAVSSIGLLSVPIGFGAMLSLCSFSMRLGYIGVRRSGVKGRSAGAVLLWEFRVFFG